ncbi:hypothetical protein [Winkia neuii]|nr:hypothetical protein [Winkia neuii]MDK8100745.1 hypothetical protein [Winkia neuii]
MGQAAMSSDTNDYRPYRGEAYYEPHRVRVKEDKSAHSSVDFNGGISFGTGAMGTGLQHLVKRMTDYPDQPCKFSQVWLVVPFMSFACLYMTFHMVMTFIYYDPNNPERNLSAIIILGAFTLFLYWFLSYGVFFRTGVDWEKVWWRFGPFYYKEVRFDEVTHFDGGVERYFLYAGKKRIRLNYVRFDFTLVLIRLLVELDKRAFMLQGKGEDAPDYEEWAQAHRLRFAHDARENHWNYYVRFPDELERIRTLAHLPAEWTAPVDEERRRLGIQVAGKPDGEGA